MLCGSPHGQVVGVLLALISGMAAPRRAGPADGPATGVLIGSSFVFKKKGLLRSQAGHEAGKGVAYLTSVSLRCAPPV